MVLMEDIEDAPSRIEKDGGIKLRSLYLAVTNGYTTRYAPLFLPTLK